MKKILALLLSLMLSFSCLTACSSDSDDDFEDVSSNYVDIEDEDNDEEIEVEDYFQSKAVPFETNDENILAIEVNQVMSYAKDPENGEISLMTNFVAEKETGIFVRFKEPVEVIQDGLQWLDVYKDGNFVDSLLPINSGEQDYAYFKPLSMTDVENWSDGAYTFEYNTMESMASITVDFREARDIKILAVPIIANYAGEVVACQGEWKTAIDFTLETYPLAKNDIEYVLGQEIDLSSSEYDLTTDEGMYNVWETLTTLQTMNKDYELILGFVRDRQGIDANIQGYTYGLPANIITESDGDMQPTVAHEIAHCYDIGDEYPGGAINQLVNPAPNGMEGSDYNDREKEIVSNKEFVIGGNEYGNMATGSVIGSEQVPFSPTTSYFKRENVTSFMGSGSSDINDYWTTSAIWNHLFNVFVIKDTKDDNDDTLPEDIYAFDFKGVLHENGDFDVEPFFAYTMESENLEISTDGEYFIQVLDANQEVISQQCFDLSFYTQTNPPKKNSFVPVNQTVYYPEEASSIIFANSEEVIYSVNISENIPTIEFIGITENQKFSGKQEISWNAYDDDGDELSYELWYVTDDDFINIASNIKENSYIVDFDSLPGCEKSYLYIYASDGTRTGEMDSPYIYVDFKAPEIITTQDGVSDYKITDEIVLDAEIYDMQDGWLYEDDEVTWYDDNGNQYMDGSLLWVFPYELSPGEHIFTVVATNEAGMSSQKEFAFNIINDESALPQDWSKNDVKYALENGFIAPLKNIDNNITRGQFADLMSMMWTSVVYTLDENAEIPEYQEGVVTDCGSDDYSEFLMVYLGLMDAQDGIFQKNKHITQEETVVIMFNTLMSAVGDIDEYTYDEVIEEFSSIKAINDREENKYIPEENSSIKLALVRCSRLYKYIFE